MNNLSDQPFVSVVVAVYRPGRGLIKCLDSLQNQTLTNIEFIFVDDCGNDGSIELLQRAAETDDRIHIIRNEKNFGPGISRNRGMKVARGSYLAFIDSDDYVSRDFFELLYTKAAAQNELIVNGTFVEVDEAGKTISDVRGRAMLERIKNGVADNKPLYSLFLAPCCCTIYLRSWIIENSIQYGTTRYGEDALFVLEATLNAKRIALEERAMYYYVQHKGSLVHTLSETRLVDQLESIKQQFDYLLEHIRNEDASPEYVISRIVYPLCIQAAAFRDEKLRSTAELFLKGLREQVQRFADMDQIMRKSKIIEALVEYNENINTMIYWREGKESIEAPYLDVMSRLASFARRHPERADLYEYSLQVATRNCIDLSMSLNDDKKEERKAFVQSLKHILLMTGTTRHNDIKVTCRFARYYCNAYAHALGHRVKERLKKSQVER